MRSGNLLENLLQQPRMMEKGKKIHQMKGKMKKMTLKLPNPVATLIQNLKNPKTNLKMVIQNLYELVQ